MLFFRNCYNIYVLDRTQHITKIFLAIEKMVTGPKNVFLMIFVCFPPYWSILRSGFLSQQELRIFVFLCFYSSQIQFFFFFWSNFGREHQNCCFEPFFLFQFFFRLKKNFACSTKKLSDQPFSNF